MTMRELIDIVEAKKSNDPCWTGYKQVGMKKKNGNEVPNCVPESVDETVPPDNKPK